MDEWGVHAAVERDEQLRPDNHLRYDESRELDADLHQSADHQRHSIFGCRLDEFSLSLLSRRCTVSTRNGLTCGSGRVAGEFVSASACRPATAWRHPAPCGKVRGNLAELSDVEVGTPVARRPPHRSRRAVFPHRAPQANTRCIARRKVCQG